MNTHGPEEKAKLNEFKQVPNETRGIINQAKKRPAEDSRKYQVRCDSCARLLGTFQAAFGEIKCPRCKHTQKIHIGGGVQKHRAA
jgi:phage FluMu protein Com